MEHILKRFEEMGARATIRLTPTPKFFPSKWNPTPPRFSPPSLVLDIKKDRRGQFYDLAIDEGANDPFNFQILDIDTKMRHLLLMSRSGISKSKFLCGHDEREWFVAGVNDSSRSILDAMERLKPVNVVSSQMSIGLTSEEKARRKNKAYIRQGEWFFTPTELTFKPNPLMVTKNEPLRRGGGKPHMAELCYRSGGETVYVNFSHPNGLTQREYNALLKRDPEASKLPWRTMTANAMVYVMGKISHPDHKTINLMGWHRVEMNREEGRGSSVRFLD